MLRLVCETWAHEPFIAELRRTAAESAESLPGADWPAEQQWGRTEELWCWRRTAGSSLRSE